MTYPYYGEPIPDPEHVLSPQERDDNATKTLQNSSRDRFEDAMHTL